MLAISASCRGESWSICAARRNGTDFCGACGRGSAFARSVFRSSARHAPQARASTACESFFTLAFDGIFAFSIVPIRTAALLGVAAMAVTIAFALYASAAKVFLGQSPRGFTALMLLITFVSGVNLFFLGVIGEYVGRVYEEVKARPLYVVSRTIRGGSA